IDVQSPQRPAAGVADFVRLPALDEDDCPGPKREPLTIDNCPTGPGDDVQPLVTAAMPIVGAALRISGAEHHLCRLRPAIADRDAEAWAEAEGFVFHQLVSGGGFAASFFLAMSSIL